MNMQKSRLEEEMEMKQLGHCHMKPDVQEGQKSMEIVQRGYNRDLSNRQLDII